MRKNVGRWHVLLGSLVNARSLQLEVVVQGDGVLQCFGHVERMGNDRIAKRVYIGECAW